MTLAILREATQPGRSPKPGSEPLSAGCNQGDNVVARAREVINLEAAALNMLSQSVGASFVEACRAILSVSGHVIVTGMGKSGHIARKGAATLAATGTPAFFLHPAEAAHGDLGMITARDLLVVLSNSGNTPELRSVVQFARRIGTRVIGIASREESWLARHADITLLLPNVREACSNGVAPTTSTTMQLALLDALAVSVMDEKGVAKARLKDLHPAGAIGLSLMTLSEIAHGPERLPLVNGHALMPEAVSVMTSGCFGLVGVVDEKGRLIGVITDGDLRRHFEELGTARAADVMTPRPKVLPADVLAGDALTFINEHKITAAFVVAETTAEPQTPIGIIHIHDLLRHGLG